MDLMGTVKVKKWSPNVKIGTHWYSVINPNPKRWRSGTKLVQHILEHRTANRATGKAIDDARNLLARSYLRLLGDHARAAHYYSISIGPGRRANARHVSNLAECYYHLGSKIMAVELLRRYGMERNGTPGAIKLWARMGYMNHAMSAAKGAMSGRAAPAAMLAAGDVCRKAGDLKKAAEFYDQAARRLQKRWKMIAQKAAEGMRAAAAVDVSRIADGQYKGKGEGYVGTIEVEVTVSAGRIEDVKIVSTRENMPFTALTDVPKSIIEKQGLKGIDTTTGATMTSEAVVHGVAMALAGATKK